MGVPFSAQTSTCGSALSRATSPLLEPVSTHVTPLKPRARRRRELGAEQVFADVLVEEEDVGGAALGDRLQFEVERAERDVDDSGCLQRRGT